MADLADYEWLTGTEAARLLDELATDNKPVHRQLSRLRKILVAERARLIVQQVELRQRAITKFGDLASQMFFTDLSLQQATDLWTARYKAARVPCDSPIVDFCCGIGGDLLAFAERGPATGWDRARELAHFAEVNLHAAGLTTTSRVCVGDVAAQTPRSDETWHIDPDRRTDGRRSTQIQWHSPGPEVVDRWLATNPAAIVKLAPATVVPTAWAKQSELEWITTNRQCRQQVVWSGQRGFEIGMRRATRLLDLPQSDQQATSASFVGSHDCQAELATEVANYLYDTDPAIRAAGLTGALALDLNLSSLQKGVSYLTSDRSVDHPLLSRFQILDQLPLRTSTLSKHLRRLNIGQLEIKKRGVDTEPEQLRRQLKLRGDHSATLLLTRLGVSEIALLARRDEG